MRVEDHYMCNYYKETKTCLLHQPLVQTCIVVTDMNPVTIKLKSLSNQSPLKQQKFGSFELKVMVFSSNSTGKGI